MSGPHAAIDVGSFAAAAFADPAGLNGPAIDLAAESLTVTEIAEAIEVVKGFSVHAVHLTVQEALEAGMQSCDGARYEWDNVEGYRGQYSSVGEVRGSSHQLRNMGETTLF